MATDPAVSRRKFEREVANWRGLEPCYRERGIWLLEAEFPKILAALVTPNARPMFVRCGVEIDFTDYDAKPPSVILVNPLTKKRMSRQELLGAFPLFSVKTDEEGGERLVAQDIVQAFDEKSPFICLPGVREYHENPAHNSDLWLYHRNKGEGTLVFLLETLWKTGAQPISQINMQVAGFIMTPPML